MWTPYLNVWGYKIFKENSGTRVLFKNVKDGIFANFGYFPVHDGDCLVGADYYLFRLMIVLFVSGQTYPSFVLSPIYFGTHFRFY
jgi:hypothetical protein